MDTHPICADQNFNKWNRQVENEPNVNHFDIACVWQVVTNADEHSCEDKQDGEINGDYGFKEKIFKVVCAVANYV